MNKSIFKILEKEKNSKTFNDEESDFFYKNKNILKCDPAFSKYLLVENDFDIIKANIVIRGLKNKEDIDTFIVEGFKNYIPNLSEILKERCLDYPCIKYDDYKVYFPFFNRITNGVYSNELSKLKDNPYSDLFLNYKAFLVDPFDTYGVDLFDSSFTKLVKVSEDLTTVSFFSYHLNCIFVINRQGGIDTMIYLFDKHLKHPNKSHVIDRVKAVLECYYTNQMRDFVSSLYKNEFISYKVFKKICKIKKI